MYSLEQHHAMSRGVVSLSRMGLLGLFLGSYLGAMVISAIVTLQIYPRWIYVFPVGLSFVFPFLFDYILAAGYVLYAVLVIIGVLFKSRFALYTFWIVLLLNVAGWIVMIIGMALGDGWSLGI
jgi:hypothetical protein